MDHSNLYNYTFIAPSSSVRNLTTSTTQQNATSILVTWNVPVLNDLNGVLLNYSINYSGIEIDTVPRVIYLSIPNLTNQSITLTDLEEYTTYSINVSAYTKVGRSPDAIVTQRTNQDGECIYFLSLDFTINYPAPILVPNGVPLNLTAYPLTPTIIQVDWTVPNIYFQNGKLTKFTLTYTSLDFDEHQEFDRIIPVRDNRTGFSFIISNLLESVTYRIRVAASTTIEGMGPSSEIETSTFHTGIVSLLCLLEYFILDRDSFELLNCESCFATQNLLSI